MARASNATGFLSRLRKDARGNTLAIMAAILIPLAAFSGSAIDMARLYVVKVRLQQACDAGVLAGRKFMTDTSTTTPLDSTASTQATTFFNNNFHSGWFTTSAVSFTPSKTSDSQVSAVASASVPMTVMKMFGKQAVVLNVACEARYDVADADVMFVLDTTGSMACSTTTDTGSGCGATISSYTRPDGTTGYYDIEQSGSKISGLRSAVLSFYDTLTANADPTTHIRYGFVTYTSTVNAGLSLPDANADLVTKWNYQTRQVVNDNVQKTNSSSTVTATSAADCATHYSRSPALQYVTNGDGSTTTVYTYSTSGTATAIDPVYAKKSGTSNTYVCTLNNDTVTPVWRYAQWPLDVSQYIAGSTVDDPSKITAATSKWQGCLEERPTTVSSSFDVNNLPPDLDPDLIPTASVDSNGVPTSSDTRWRPMWPDVIYYRGSNMTSSDSAGGSTNPYGDTTTTSQMGTYTNMLLYNNIAYGYVSCGKPVQRLTTMARTDVSNYVNATDFKPQGGTYHDTGMIWGTRMISPNGIYAADTAAWPGHQAPNRYIVFMTDGYMSPNQNIYGMYGMEYYDKRVTGGTYSNDTDYHNTRFVTECAAAKARNITVFVVSFGSTLNSQLTSCASPGDAYYASNNSALTAAFQSIANQVAMLRISK